MLLAVFFFSVSIFLSIIFLGKFLGPEGILASKKRLKQRIAGDISDTPVVHTERIRKQYNLSHIRLINRLLEYRAFPQKIAALIKSAKLGISVSFFLMISIVIGIVSFIVARQWLAPLPALLLSVKGLSHKRIFYAIACVCGPTVSSSVRCAARKPWTCCRP